MIFMSYLFFCTSPYLALGLSPPVIAVLSALSVELVHFCKKRCCLSEALSVFHLHNGCTVTVPGVRRLRWAEDSVLMSGWECVLVNSRKKEGDRDIDRLCERVKHNINTLKGTVHPKMNLLALMSFQTLVFSVDMTTVDYWLFFSVHLQWIRTGAFKLQKWCKSTINYSLWLVYFCE